MSKSITSSRPDAFAVTQALRCSYWRNYRGSLHAQSSGPVQQIAIQKLWRQREQAGIWPLVFVPLAVSGKATIRRRQARRLRNALKEALYARELSKPMDRPFTGTLHVHAGPQITQTEYSDLRYQCNQVISQIIATGARKMKNQNSNGLEKQAPFKASSNSSPIWKSWKKLPQDQKDRYASPGSPSKI